MPVTAMSGDQLQRLAELVRQQDPALDTRMMEADGKYQTRSAPLDVLTRDVRECLALDFARRRPDDFPMHYFAWGKCRVGSTPLTNLFGLTGMPSYYQPVKMILRHAFVSGTAAPRLVPRATDAPEIFSKETAGPYCLAESLFNPLQLLIEAGYPPDRLHVIAALNAVRVEGYARRHGLPVTHYVYEASKDPVSSVRVLFDRLGLAARFSDGAVTDWQDTGQLKSERSRITFNDEPKIYDLKNLHGSDTAYRYRMRATGSLSQTQRDILQSCGVNDIYRGSVQACVRDLGLNATTSERLFGHAIGAAA
jgi:hypothetical protein